MLALPWLSRSDRSNWTWGLNLWSYIGSDFAHAAVVAGLAALVVAALVALRAGARAPAPALRVAGATTSRAGLLVPAALCIGLFALLWWAREASHFLGDTHIRLDDITKAARGRTLLGALIRSRAAPLDEVGVLYGGGRIAALLGLDSMAVGQAIPCVFGALFGLAAYRISRRLGGPSGWALPLAALLAEGYMELFAGYQETYGLQLVLLAFWMDALLEARETGVLPVRAHAFLGLAFLAHRDSVLLLPAHALAAWRARARTPAARLGLGAGVLTLCLAILAVFWARQLGEDIRFLAAAGPPDPRGYSLLSWFHASHVANDLFLLAPIGLASLALATAFPGSLRRHAVLLLAAAPFWALSLVVRSNVHGLGPVRDWDALAPSGFFLALVAAILVVDSVRAAPRVRALWWAVVCAAALQAGAWLALNASPRASLERAEATTYARPVLPSAPASLAFDALAKLHQDLGRPVDAARDYLSAAECVDNPRFRWAAGVNLFAAGDPRDAYAQFVHAGLNPVFREEMAAGLIQDLHASPREPMLLAMRDALFQAEAASAASAPSAGSPSATVTPPPSPPAAPGAR